jgi:hypothetical protein
MGSLGGYGGAYDAYGMNGMNGMYPAGGGGMGGGRVRSAGGWHAVPRCLPHCLAIAFKNPVKTLYHIYDAQDILKRRPRDIIEVKVSTSLPRSVAHFPS